MAGKQQYDDTNRGALFKNDRKTKDTDRDYSGSLNVGGHDFWISGWIKDGRNGKFLSLSVKQKDGKPQQEAAPQRTQQQRRAEMDDEIPF
jgi:hypothetical protein